MLQRVINYIKILYFHRSIKIVLYTIQMFYFRKMKQLLRALLLTIVAFQLLHTVTAISKPYNNNIHYTRSSIREEETHILPKNLIPISYDIFITPYLENPLEKLFTFDGKITITFQVNISTNQIIIHAHDELNIDESIISVVNTENFPPTLNPVFNVSKSSDEKSFFIVTLTGNMTQNAIYAISMAYNGTINDNFKGFYKSSYMDNNIQRWIATTQLGPYFARRVFPCFDEPEMKAKFKINIAREPGYNVVSNMPIESQNQPVNGLPAGWVWVKFNETEVMSTYLVAFSINQFSVINYLGGDRTLKLWSRGRIVQQGQYANSIVTPNILTTMEKFTNYNYSLPKMDQLAIPDFEAGAMENWGMINYRDNYLLYEEGVSTSRDKQRITEVVAHELSQQWFGNLVTPQWWDNLWLNKGFASFFEYHAAAEVEPDWQMREQFVVQKMHLALRKDASRSTHAMIINVASPASIDSMFDIISYNKGGSIVRMLAGLMGNEKFKTGIQHYIDTRAFKTATSDHLWQSLQTQVPPVALPSRTSLKNVMDTWTLQAGYPVLTVIRNYTENSALISQTRFVTSPNHTEYDELWIIPVTMTSQMAPDFSDFRIKLWHSSINEVSISRGFPDNDQWIIVNNMQIGYYRVNYDIKNWELLIKSLNNDSEMKEIHIINRAQIMDDALALAQANLLNYEIAIDTTSYLTNETEYIPWAGGLSALEFLKDRLYEDETRELFEWYIQEKIDNMYKRVNGFEINSNDTHIMRNMQNLILTWSCNQKHEDCIKEADVLFKSWQNQNVSVKADVLSVVSCIGVQKGSQAAYDFIFDHYEKAVDKASLQTIFLNALGCASEPNILKSYLQETNASHSQPRIPNKDAHLVVTAVYNNHIGIDLALTFLLDNFQTLPQLYGNYRQVNRIFEDIAGKLNTVNQREELNVYALNNNVTAEGAAILASAVQIVDENLLWQRNHRNAVLDHLTKLRKASNVSSALIASSFILFVSIFNFII